MGADLKEMKCTRLAPKGGLFKCIRYCHDSPRRLEAALSRSLTAVSPGETTLSWTTAANDQNITLEGPTRVQNKSTKCP